MPKRIGRLGELASNLWWSWHAEGRNLWRALDFVLWRNSNHNPIRLLRGLSPDKLKAAANDPAFLDIYDAAVSAFDASLSREAWFTTQYPDTLSGPIAYFSMEFAIHNSLPIYAGGLGILAGDICKEASDLGIPMVAIGFMYPQGYFEQHISAEGWQEETYRQINFDEAPINPCPWPEACGPLVQLQMNKRQIFIEAWQVRLGRVNLYLLDTNVEENSPQDRQLSARLYTSDREQRIQQEIILGIGGVRVLRLLGIKPSVWHANEGHTAFMMLERVRQEVEQGVPFPQALQRIQKTTVFTTHTPVPAGHDIFPTQLMEKYFQDYWGQLGTDRKTFIDLGKSADSGDQTFNMTALALRTSNWRNGVSKLHGEVARQMWHSLWPNAKEEQVPISHITNGVHVPTWIAPEMYQVYESYLGPDLLKKQDDVELWQRILQIPDDELWYIRQDLRRKLIHIILERAQVRWAQKGATAQQVLAMGALLDPDVLTIVFARRFTEYKRPALVFQDIERLKQIVRDPFRPVQIIFAGKSHPSDFTSKYLLHQVHTLATDREFQGRIAFVEDYDMEMAHYLVQGVDVWLNTPRRLQEACGTSGMKASMNGVLHLSVRDGWWYEGYNGKNGWAIGDGPRTPKEEDKADSEAIYQLLEKEIVPLYYDRDRKGVPLGWMQMVKQAIASVLPTFCARRMLKEYTERAYIPAIQSLKTLRID